MPAQARAGTAVRQAPAIAVQAVNQTYVESGGDQSLGKPEGMTLAVTDLGCSQNYSKDNTVSAIIAPGCGGVAYAVPREIWEYAKNFDEVEIGIAVGPAIIISTGVRQTFDGGNLQTTEIIAPREGSIYAVSGALRDYYLADSTSDKLGLPKSEQYEWMGEVRQDFERGSLVWRAETGVREMKSWMNGQLYTGLTPDIRTYIIQGNQSFSYSNSDHLVRCQQHAVVERLGQDQLQLTQKQYPVAGTAPDCATELEKRAIAWAQTEMKSKSPAWSDKLGAYWSGKCEAFVEIAYGTRFRAESAMSHYRFRLKKGTIHTDTSPPAGSFVFYGGSADGHVGIALGDGYVISTQGYAGNRLPIWKHSIRSLTNPYLGWARYDGSWPR